MKIETYEVKISVEVFDKEEMYAAALARAIAEGSTEEDAVNLLRHRGEIDVSACLVMLFDPGVSPSGTEIQNTDTEYMDSNGEEEDD